VDLFKIFADIAYLLHRRFPIDRRTRCITLPGMPGTVISARLKWCWMYLYFQMYRVM